jgi:hypothetical protein
VGLIIDRPGKGVPIVQDLREAPFISSIEDFVSYPRVIGNINPLRRRLEEILIEAGLLKESEIIRKTPTLIDAKPQNYEENKL